MDWPEVNANAPNKNQLRRSVSSFGFNLANCNAGIREAKSFTGALQELKSNKQIVQEQHDPNYYMKKLSEHTPVVKETEYITKEVSSDKIFVVRNAMLNYRGKQYSMSDIATRWKKDCRMWLWKGSISKRTKSVSDIQERLEALRLPTSI